jgi:hypothetical protein
MTNPKMKLGLADLPIVAGPTFKFARGGKADNSSLMRDVPRDVAATWSPKTQRDRFTYWTTHPNCTIREASGHPAKPTLTVVVPEMRTPEIVAAEIKAVRRQIADEKMIHAASMVATHAEARKRVESGDRKKEFERQLTALLAEEQRLK